MSADNPTTIEELLELPTADKAALTDEQLYAHLQKYFPFTRPAHTLSSGVEEHIQKKVASFEEQEATLLAKLKAARKSQ